MCRTKASISSMAPKFRERSSADTQPASSSSSLPSLSISSSSSASSLAAARAAVPAPPALYSFSEIAAATNRFLSRKHSGGAFWRCSLRGADAAVYQLALSAGAGDELAAVLSRLGKIHHRSIAKLLGAAAAGAHVYIAYEFIAGAPLSSCLRNPRNPTFTVLSSWASRMRIADAVAQGLEYIHSHSGAHCSISSANILVTEEEALSGKIMLSGAADIAGGGGGDAAAAQAADVYGFGLLLLELISGKEPVRRRYDKGKKEFVEESVIATARAAAEGGGVRGWVDVRLRDSFPVPVAEKMVTVGLRCTEEDAAARPDMAWVAGRVAKGFLQSAAWEETMKGNDGISVTVAPR